MKGMDIRSEKIHGYKHGSGRDSAFFNVTKARYDWISHKRVSREPYVVDSGFIAQIKQKLTFR